MKSILAIAVMASILPMATPAAAQRLTEEEREAAYLSCRSEYVRRNMGNDDAANAYCYDKYYNEDPWSPPPTNPCGPTSSFTCTRPD